MFAARAAVISLEDRLSESDRQFRQHPDLLVIGGVFVDMKRVKLPPGFKIALYAVVPDAPHLAGQPAIYIVEQLKNYRSGKRQNEVMSVMAKPLTDREIDDLAAWYESIQISVTVK